MLPWLFVQKGKYNKMCCPLEAIRPSPAQVNLHKCVKAFISDTFLHRNSLLFMSSVWIGEKSVPSGRQSTETSVNSSFPRARMAKTRPSVSAWENTKVAPAQLWVPQRRAMCRPRPKGWSANFRSSSGTRLSKTGTSLSPRALPGEWAFISVNESSRSVSLTGQRPTLCTVLKLMKDTGSS